MSAVTVNEITTLIAANILLYPFITICSFSLFYDRLHDNLFIQVQNKDTDINV